MLLAAGFIFLKILFKPLELDIGPINIITRVVFPEIFKLLNCEEE